MSHFAVLPVPPSTPRIDNRGVSKESAAVDQSYAEAFRRFYSSVKKQQDVSNRKQMFAALLDGYSSPGWDGADAVPTTLEAVSRSYELLAHLPPRLASPDVSVNRYGDVELEWYVRPDKIFTLAIGDDGRFHFASLNGLERRSGAGYIGGVPPDIILGIVAVLEP